jgi:hypothetical protein
MVHPGTPVGPRWTVLPGTGVGPRCTVHPGTPVGPRWTVRLGTGAIPAILEEELVFTEGIERVFGIV